MSHVLDLSPGSAMTSGAPSLPADCGPPPGQVSSAAAWHRRLGRAASSFVDSAKVRGEIARFRDIDRRIVQPALEQHVLAVHLGGAKRVIRRQDGHRHEAEVAEGSYTIMPAREPFEWETFGPIDFAHVTIDPEDLRQAALAECDADPDQTRLDPVLGVRNDEIRALVGVALAAPTCAHAEPLVRQTARALLVWHLLRRDGAERTGGDRPVRGKFATWQLRRVLDYMHDHLTDDVDLAHLAALTGVGRARFYFLFKASMGRSPHAYLRYLRLLRARELLVDTNWPIGEIAAAVGLEPTRLAVAFRSTHAISPRAFRRARSDA